MPVRGVRDRGEEIWAVQVLLLFCSAVGGDTDGGEMASVRFVECVTSLKAVGDVLLCVCLRRSAGEDEENESDVYRLDREDNRTAARKWLGVVSLK